MEKTESEKKQIEKEKRMNIIKETIKKCVIYSSESNKPTFSFIRKIKNASNIIKFNYLKRCLKSKYPENSIINLNVVLTAVGFLLFVILFISMIIQCYNGFAENMSHCG